MKGHLTEEQNEKDKNGNFDKCAQSDPLRRCRPFGICLVVCLRVEGAASFSIWLI